MLIKIRLSKGEMHKFNVSQKVQSINKKLFDHYIR